jgi:hypothetical protein
MTAEQRDLLLDLLSDVRVLAQAAREAIAADKPVQDETDALRKAVIKFETAQVQKTAPKPMSDERLAAIRREVEWRHTNIRGDLVAELLADRDYHHARAEAVETALAKLRAKVERCYGVADAKEAGITHAEMLTSIEACWLAEFESSERWATRARAAEAALANSGNRSVDLRTTDEVES